MAGLFQDSVGWAGDHYHCPHAPTGWEGNHARRNCVKQEGSRRQVICILITV